MCLDGTLKKYEDLATFKSDLESILGVDNSENSTMKQNLFNFNFLKPKDKETEDKA